MSPKTSDLLQRRFNYARQIAEGKTEKGSQLQKSKSANIVLSLPRVATFLSVCELSFQQKSLSTLFDAVSNGNVRDLLTYVRQFITSKHLNTAKIIQESTAGYRIPDHEALRALLFGDSVHYDPTRSVIANLFDLSRADPTEHFTRLFVLIYLVRMSNVSASRGYVTTNDLMQYLCQLGYSDEHARRPCSSFTPRSAANRLCPA